MAVGIVLEPSGADNLPAQAAGIVPAKADDGAAAEFAAILAGWLLPVLAAPGQNSGNDQTEGRPTGVVQENHAAAGLPGAGQALAGVPGMGQALAGMPGMGQAVNAWLAGAAVQAPDQAGRLRAFELQSGQGLSTGLDAKPMLGRSLASSSGEAAARVAGQSVFPAGKEANSGKSVSACSLAAGAGSKTIADGTRKSGQSAVGAVPSVQTELDEHIQAINWLLKELRGKQGSGPGQAGSPFVQGTPAGQTLGGQILRLGLESLATAGTDEPLPPTAAPAQGTGAPAKGDGNVVAGNGGSAAGKGGMDTGKTVVDGLPQPAAIAAEQLASPAAWQAGVPAGADEAFAAAAWTETGGDTKASAAGRSAEPLPASSGPKPAGALRWPALEPEDSSGKPDRGARASSAEPPTGSSGPTPADANAASRGLAATLPNGRPNGMPKASGPVAASSGKAQQPPANDIWRARNVLGQVVGALSRDWQRPRVHELEIQLQPAELGKISIALRWDGGQLDLHLQASEAATGQLLQNHTTELRAALTGLGIQCGQLLLGFGGQGQPNGQREMPRFLPSQRREQTADAAAGEILAAHALTGISGLTENLLNVTA